MKVMVTGSEGFIGKALTERLKSKGHKVVEVDKIKGYNVSSITMESVRNCDVIVHLAAQTSVWNDNHGMIIKDNIEAFTHIVRVSNYMRKKLVYASSSTAESATSMYGLSKRFNEEYAAIYADNAVGLRFHNVYSATPRRGTLLANLLDSARKGKPAVLYNNGENMRHFTHLSDILDGIEYAMENDCPKLMNILNPETNTVLEFAEEVRKNVPSLDFIVTGDVLKYDREVQFVNMCLEYFDTNYKTIREGLSLEPLNLGQK